MGTGVLDELRKIALVIWYLKAVLKKGLSADLPDGRLATMLNEAGKGRPGGFHFEAEDINKLSHIKELDLKTLVRRQIVEGLQGLINQKSLNVDMASPLPKFIEEDYADKLPLSFRHPLPTSQLEGTRLGEDEAKALNGLWQMFFFRPPDEANDSPLIRGKAIIIRDAHLGCTSAPVDVISEHSHWKGHCFLNQSHLYIVATHVQRTDSHFYIVNRPREGEAFVFGIGSTIHRPPEVPGAYRLRPVEAYCLFGYKWTPDKSTSEDLRSLHRFIETGDPITRASQVVDQIRAHFSAPNVKFSTESEFQQSHRELFAYLQSVRINNKPAVGVNAEPPSSLLRLQVAWD